LATGTSHVVVYATCPVQRVLGWFEIETLEDGSPGALWRRFRRDGAISPSEFRRYYKGRAQGTAIVVGAVVGLEQPLRLDALGVVPPQSYRYLDEPIIEQLEIAAGRPLRLANLAV
jgi:predicted transcriptional regulator